MKTFFTLKLIKLTGLAFLSSMFFVMDAAAQCPAPSLSFPSTANQTLSAANGAAGVIAADFTGDGKLDLALSNNSAGTVSIFVNNGSGTFSTAFNLTVGANPYEIAAADFNGDGKADLVTANANQGSVFYFPSNGDGTFGAGTTVGTGFSGTRSVNTGDFNGDGKQDIVVAGYNNSNVTIFLGNGSGGFTFASTYSVGSNPSYVIAADLNGDGNLDLATANNGTVSVLLGNGNGTFQSPALSFTSASTSFQLCVGDFNNDGRLDLASANVGSNNVSVFINNGAASLFPSSGTSYTVVTTSHSNSPYGITCADLNGDGKLDIAAIDYYTSTGISVLTGKGDGTFNAFTALPCNTTGSQGSLSIVAGDFNDDGKWDLAVGNQNSTVLDVYLNTNTNTPAPIASVSGTTPVCTSGTLTLSSSVLTSSGSGSLAYSWVGPNSFSSAVQNPPAIINPSTLAGGTYTLTVTDSRGCTGITSKAVVVSAPPAATASAVSPVCTSGSVNLVGGPSSQFSYLWSGPNSFTSALQRPSFSATTAAAGVYTLTVASAPGCTAIATTGAVTVNASTFTNQSLTICAGQSIMVGTVTHNATGTYIDASTGGNGCPNIVTTKLKVLFGAGGSPSFPGTASQSLPAGSKDQGLISADFNGDGKPDLAVANQSSAAINVYINNGSGTFSTTNTISVASPNELAAADFNGDGKADLVAITVGGSVLYYQSNGDGTFAAATTVGSGLSFNTTNSVTTGDFNGDGNQDIAATSSGVLVYLGNGSGGFSAGVSYPTGSNPYYVTTADFNGDGRADLAVANGSANTVSVLLGNGDGTFQSKTDFAIGSGPWWLCTGDFNGDGNIDIASANHGSGTVSVLIGNGTGGFASHVDYTVATGSGATNSPYGVATADLNGDGKLDLVSVDYFNTTNSISLLTGNGDGTFQTPYVPIPSGNSQSFLTVVADDFNGDGLPDLAFALQTSAAVNVYLNTTSASSVATASGTNTCPGGNLLLTGSPSGLSTYTWSGPNGFTSSLQNPTLSGVTTAVAGVYTLTVSGSSGCSSTATTSSITVSTLAATADAVTPACTGNSLPLTGEPSAMQSYSWLGPNSFTSSVQSPAISSVTTAASGVYTLSVVSTSGCSATAITVSAVVNVSTSASQSLAICAGQSIAVGTVTHDATGTYIDYNGSSCTLETTKLKVLFGNGGQPAFLSTPSQTLTAGIHGADLTAADFNGDGKPDLAYLNQNGNNISIFLNNGSGTFGAPSTAATTSSPNVMAAGDFNNDGKADLLTINLSGTLSYYQNTGSGTSFAAGVTVGPVNWSTAAGIAIGDFNGDGNQDIAGVGGGSNTVIVYFGNGSGGFSAGVSYPTGSGPYCVVTADFNGDGKADLAVGNGLGNTVSVLLGNGDGTFKAKTDYPDGGTTPFVICTGDFNGDGSLDIATGNKGNGTVSVLINNGTGGFANGIGYPVASSNSPYGISCADLNGDGKLDLIATDYNVSNGTSILLGNGDGTFPTTYIKQAAGGTDAITVVADDFNGDGLPDLAVGIQLNSNSPINIYLNTSSSSVVATASGTNTCPGGNLLLTGSPSGLSSYSWTGPNGFSSSLQNPTIPGVTTAVAGVYTLTVSGSSGCSSTATTSSISVTTQTANASVITPVCSTYPLALTGGPTAMQTYTWTGPNNFTSSVQSPTIASASTAASGVYTLSVVSTGGCSAIATTVPVTVNASTSTNQSLTICAGQSIMVGTVTHNATGTYIDASTGGNGCPNIVTTKLKVLFGTGGSPSFPATAGQSLPAGSKDQGLISADFNGDGKPDLAVANQSSAAINVYINNGSGTFSSTNTISVASPNELAAADFNGDGKADLVAITVGGSVLYYQSNGDGTFAAATTVGSGLSFNTTNSVTTGDFNGDGNQDIAATSSGVLVYLGNGSGGFSAGVSYPTGSNPYYVTTADFNGDGRADLAVANGSANTVSVLLGNGDGTFQSKTDFAIGSGPWWLCTGDFNGDGNIDIASANHGSGTVSVLIGNGTGGFATHVDYTVATGSGATNSPYGVATADLNGDGKLDLVSVDYFNTTNSISLLTGNGDGTFQTPYVPMPSGNSQSFLTVVADDFNGDGLPDLAFALQTSAAVNVYLNTTPATATATTASATTPVCPNGTLGLTGGTLNVATYSWSGPNSFTSSAQNPTIVEPGILGAGVYSLTVTDSRGCTGTAVTAAVVMQPLPTISVTPASAVCTGGTSATLTASGSVSGYTWSPSTNLTTTNSGLTETAQISQLTFYTVSGTGSNGCSNITVVPVATVATGGAISPAFSIICSGNTQTLTVVGAAGHDYQWQISTDNANWTNITAATNTTYTTVSGDGNSNKFYRLMAQSNSCWNVASTTGEVDVSNPTITITATNITDNSLTLNWSPTGTGNYSISYSGSSSGTQTSVTPVKTITGLTSNSTYSITVTQTGVSGCPASGTVTGVTTLCAMPTGVTLSSPAPAQIQVSWTGVVGADYRIYYRPLFSYNTYFTKDVSNASSVLLTKQGANNLYASTTYEVYVSRLDCPTTGAVGQGTNPTNVTTLPSVTCAIPQIDSVRSLCPVQIEVFIHDNGVNQYNVFVQRITPSILAVNSYGISGTYFTINTPYSGDQYLIAVEAKCGSALSSLCVYPGNVTIKPLCTSPSNLVLSNPTCHGFTASWNADQCLSNSASAYDLYLRVAGTINYNSYGVILPGNSIGPNKLINWATSGRTYQVFVRSVYNCNGFVTYGPTSDVETITTLSSGCRDEEQTNEPQENKPATQQYSPDKSEVFSLYPNPNTGKFVVDLSRLNMEEDAVRIEVINMLGQTVLTHLTTIGGGHLSEYINLPNGVAAGTYIVRLTAGKNVYTAKINISK